MSAEVVPGALLIRGGRRYRVVRLGCATGGPCPHAQAATVLREGYGVNWSQCWSLEEISEFLSEEVDTQEQSV